MVNQPSETAGTAVTPPGQLAARLEQAAHQLARNHQLAPGRLAGDGRLLARLPQQAQLLRQAYHFFAQSAEEKLTLSYAAEWLLDNFYLVQQATRQVRKDLPPGYYHRLPKLDSISELSGFPRVYDLVRQLVLYDEAHLDLERVRQFVEAYQSIRPLTMGELWALPIMLRFSLLESLTQAVCRLTGIVPPGPAPPPALQFDFSLADADVVAHCIPALRLLGTQEWKKFFESISHVERILNQDPAAIYGRMEFETRDHYRKAVETLAQQTGLGEAHIAQTAVALAQEALNQYPAAARYAPNGRTLGQKPSWLGLDLPRACHVGFYLQDDGRVQLEQKLGYRPAGLRRLGRWALHHPTAVYLGSIALLTFGLLLALLRYAQGQAGAGGQLMDGTAVSALTAVTAAGLLALIPASAIAVSLVNWFITQSLPPRILPKLDLEDGIPPGCRAIVVIPTLLTNQAEVESLLSQLERHYLRNPEPHISFALLTDFVDAPQAEMPEDDALIAQARAGIDTLNRRYPAEPFYLFHRRRLWNPAENTWMGWERKRGKLHEFNRLLRGDLETTYDVQVGRLIRLPKIRYVITLDADTVLPQDSARRLIATLAHPLNQAQFDPETGRVVAGYTILQPRTQIKPVSANQSFFTRVFAGDTGLDLYTLAVSDVYQDLFGAGIYVGKGIYDVDAFEYSLAERAPDNTLLSHDLFEGIHGRTGLVTDVILYEDYPPPLPGSHPPLPPLDPGRLAIAALAVAPRAPRRREQGSQPTFPH